MPIRDVSEQMRSKWRRRSEPLLSVLNQKHQQQQLSLTPPSVLQTSDEKEQQSLQQQNELRQNHTQQHKPEVSQGKKTNKKKTPLPTDMTSNPDTTIFGIGDYQFISQLGEGKFSKVMLAQHYLTGEKFAIKGFR
ncbi:hypothetical protein BCR42DRAFT_102863 [Absidia repens]|uniref:Protein kinase domain-containing protein n=1 Tax=Absidia repens TaxID=90262 RepID=A0A1X2I950_9FUNG|nr:hypothetical protein BCR42DRAFT_102863 [Absidia repens]